MSKITQLTRHAMEHKYKVFGVLGQEFDDAGSAGFLHLPESFSAAIKQPNTCVIIDIMKTLSSAQSTTLATAVVKNIETIQSELDLSSGCLALSSHELKQTCVVYPPSSSIILDVEQFYSSDIALLVRTIFSPTHALVQWLDYTEAYIQKQHIVQQLPAATNTTRKKL